MKRALSGAERAVWKQGAISLNIVMAAEIKGDLHLSVYRQCWDILQDKHPLLKAHLELIENNVYISTEDPVPVPISEIGKSESTDIDYLQTRELQTPFDFFSGQPLIRSLLIHKSAGAEIVITCHHLIADGLSMVFLIRDILLCLSGREGEIQYSDPGMVMDTLLPPEIRQPLWARGGIKAVNFVLSQLGPMSVAKITMPESRIVKWELDSDVAGKFKKICKAQQVSIHAAVSTIFQRAQAVVQGTKDSKFSRVYSPVSLRHILTGHVKESFGLFASEAYITYSYNLEADLWENVREFQRAMAAAICPEKQIFPLVVANSLLPNIFDRLLIKLYKGKRIKFGFVISNLGNYTFSQKYGAYELVGIGPPLVYVQRAEKTLTLLTVAKKMAFTLTYRPEVVSPEIILAIKKNAMQAIVELGN